MAYDHKAVGTLIHVDGLLQDPTWANGSSDTLTDIYDTIEHIARRNSDKETGTTGSHGLGSQASLSRDNEAGPLWTVSAWPSSAGTWFVVHHRPTTYTIRTQSLERLQDKIIRRFQTP
jgi:hypothetical protein